MKEMMHDTMLKLMNDAGWQDEAEKLHPQAYNEWLGTVNSVGVSENCTAEDIHAMYRDAFELPTNMQAPVHTRWMTIMKAVVAFRGNFIKIYFFTVAIKQWKIEQKAPQTEYILTLCNTLLSLLNTRSKIDKTAQSSIEEQAEAHSSTLNPGDSPTFYAFFVVKHHSKVSEDICWC
jgi:hypothetical protein